MTIASLVAVRNSPVAEIMFGWFKIDRISNSFCVSSLDCFRRLMNLTATSFPLRISWQRRTTENRPRPSSSSSMYRRSKSRCQHASRLEVEFCCNTLNVFRCGQISEAENKILGGSITNLAGLDLVVSVHTNNNIFSCLVKSNPV